jgi:DNA-binding MarR family transcriptional regulator
MFGLALRSYQQKVQRLSESATDSGLSLWAAVSRYLGERRVALKAEVLQRFSHDDSASVRGILNDLVSSGLVAQAGRGDATEYRMLDEAELVSGQKNEAEAQAALTWVHVYREGPMRRDDLCAQLNWSAEDVQRALDVLVADGRVEERVGEDGRAEYVADRCFIALEDTAGWEAAVVDHHRAMMTSLALKIRGGAPEGTLPQEIGGSTFAFHLCPGHPKEAEVRALLQETRSRLARLWDEVVEHNRQRARGDEEYRVTFYFGQSLQSTDREDDT